MNQSRFALQLSVVVVVAGSLYFCFGLNKAGSATDRPAAERETGAGGAGRTPAGEGDAASREIATSAYDQRKDILDAIRRLAFDHDPADALADALAVAGPGKREASLGVQALFETVRSDLSLDGRTEPALRNPDECARYLIDSGAQDDFCRAAQESYVAIVTADPEHRRFRELILGWPFAPQIEVDRILSELSRTGDPELRALLTRILGTESGRRAVLLYLERLLKKGNDDRQAIIVYGLLADERIESKVLLSELVAIGSRFQRDAGDGRSQAFDLAILVAGALDGEAANKAASLDDARRETMIREFSSLPVGALDDASAITLSMIFSSAGPGAFRGQLEQLAADVRRSAMARESAIVSLGIKLPADVLLTSCGVDVKNTPTTSDESRLALGMVRAVQNSARQFPESAGSARSAYRTMLESWSDTPAARTPRLYAIGAAAQSGSLDLVPTLEFLAKNSGDDAVRKAAADAVFRLNTSAPKDD